MFFRVVLSVAILFLGGVALQAEPSSSGASAQRLTLEQCLARARANNARMAVGRADLEMARAALGQALSAYWPTLSADVKATRLDEDPVFTFPGSTYEVPAMTIAVPDMSVSVPGRQVGPVSVPSTTVSVPGQSYAVPAQSFSVPEQEIKVMDRDTVVAGVYATLPLFTGGLRPALAQQARAGIASAEQQLRRTEADLVYDTTRFYYGAVLAAQLTATARDTLERMEATQELTERMYSTGSGKVKKTDFLRSRSMVEVIRGALAEVESRGQAARAALAMALGEGGMAAVEPADAAIPFRPQPGDLAAAIAAAQAGSPDLSRAEAGRRAAAGKLQEARSGHWPKVALLGAATHLENGYDMGATDARNTDNWMIGVGATLPLFEGFRVSYQVREAAAGLQRMNYYRDLLADVIALQVKLAWSDLDRVIRQEQSARAGLAAATENRQLNVRAYQDELVETKDVIEAQLTEAVLQSQYYRVLFEHADARARLDQIAGRAGAGEGP